MRGKDKVTDAAENIKPYVERAMADEKLRDDVMRAFGSAREIYKDLMGEKSALTLASRVATDDDIRDKLRDAIEDLRTRTSACKGRRSIRGATRPCSSRASRSGCSSTRSRGLRRADSSRRCWHRDDERRTAPGGSNGRG